MAGPNQFASSFSAVISTAGDNTVITPAAVDRFIRVLWVCVIPANANTVDNLTTIKFNGGTTIYTVYAVSKERHFDGNKGQNVVVNLANNNPVAVNIHYLDLK